MSKTKIEDDGCEDSSFYWLESTLPPAWMTEKLSRQEEKKQMRGMKPRQKK